MSRGNTLPLLFSGGGHGSCRSRDRREVVSPTANQLCRKPQQFRKIETAFSESPSSLEHLTQNETIPKFPLDAASAFQQRRVRWMPDPFTLSAAVVYNNKHRVDFGNKRPLLGYSIAHSIAYSCSGDAFTGEI